MKGIQYHKNRRLKAAIAELLTYMMKKRVWKHMDEKADWWWRYRYETQAFVIWRRYTQQFKAKNQLATRKAIQFHKALILEQCLSTWRINAVDAKEVRKATVFYNGKITRANFVVWFNNAHKLRLGNSSA